MTDSEIQEMLRHEMMRNSKDLTDDPTFRDGSAAGLIMSREERDNLSGSQMPSTQGEMRLVLD